MPTNPSDEPAAQAHALLERLFALLHDCRAVVPQLEPARTNPEPVSAQAERLLYYALVGAIEAGLVRLRNAIDYMRHASPPGRAGADPRRARGRSAAPRRRPGRVYRDARGHAARAAGIGRKRQAEYQRKMSTLLAGRETVTRGRAARGGVSER